MAALVAEDGLSEMKPMPVLHVRSFCLGLPAAIICLGAASAAPTYERDVVPILRTYCAGCHNDADREGELSVERFASLRKGGAESGDPVKAGEPDASVMLRRIASTAADHMPPADEPQPSTADVAVLREWIAAGAPGPAVDASLLETLVVPALPAYAGRLPVTALAISPDGTRAAVARGRTLQMHDVATAGGGDLAGAPVVASLGRSSAPANRWSFAPPVGERSRSPFPRGSRGARPRSCSPASRLRAGARDACRSCVHPPSAGCAAACSWSSIRSSP